MKFSGFLLIAATLFLGGCSFEKPPEDQNLIAQVQADQSEVLFEKPMRAAFLIDVRGKLYSFDHPDFIFKSERAFLSPQAKNIVYFRAHDVTWSEFLGTLGVKVENNCLVVPEETVCPEQDERLEVMINNESNPFDAERKMQSGDRMYLGVTASGVSREMRSQMPDPWLGEE